MEHDLVAIAAVNQELFYTPRSTKVGFACLFACLSVCLFAWFPFACLSLCLFFNDFF